MKSYEELKKEVGFGLATLVYFHKISQKAKDAFTFSEWWEIFKAVPEDNEVEKVALEKMQAVETSPRELVRAYIYELPYSKKAEEQVKFIILDKLLSSESNLEEWFELYKISREEAREICWEKIKEKKPSFSWWKKALSTKDEHTSEDLFIQQMFKEASSLDDFIALYHSISSRCDGRKEKRKVCLVKMINLARTFDDWLKIYNLEKDCFCWYSDLENLALKESTAISAEEWRRIEHENDDFFMEKMFATASKLSDWTIIFGFFRVPKPFSDRREVVLGIMKQKRASFPECVQALHYSHYWSWDDEKSPREAEEVIWEKILSQVRTLDLRKLLELAPFVERGFFPDFDSKQELIEKYEEKIESLCQSFEDWQLVSRKLLETRAYRDWRYLYDKSLKEMTRLAKSPEEHLVVMQLEYKPSVIPTPRNKVRDEDAVQRSLEAIWESMD